MFWRYGWLKNPAIWLAENNLAHISGTNISQIWNPRRNTATNTHFHLRINSVKTNNQILQQIKKTVFSPFSVHFPNFGGKKTFEKNPALSRTISYGFLAPCQNLEKTNDTIPRKCTDRQKSGQTYGTLLVTASGPKITSLFVHLILSTFSVDIIHDGIWNYLSVTVMIYLKWKTVTKLDYILM